MTIQRPYNSPSGKNKQPTVTRLFNIAHHEKTALEEVAASRLHFLVPNNVYLRHADIA
ncbi:MAG: hypothetical protein WAK48_09540 [Candidatus Acidiferrum sp.]